MSRVAVAVLVSMVCAAASVGPARAGDDELEVYADTVEEPGGLDLELLAATTFSGRRDGRPGRAGDAPHALSLVPEVELGMARGLELDLYVMTSRSAMGAWQGDGMKLQLKYVHAKTRPSSFFWGVVGEVARVSGRISESRTRLELRPILGWRRGRWLLALNPKVEIPASREVPRRPEVEPSAKVSYGLTKSVRAGLEHYAELGELGDLDPRSEQTHVLFAVVEADVGLATVNAGVGRGLTAASPGWAAKTILEFHLD